MHAHLRANDLVAVARCAITVYLARGLQYSIERANVVAGLKLEKHLCKTALHSRRKRALQLLYMSVSDNTSFTKATQRERNA
jgi:hypothetical protein